MKELKDTIDGMLSSDLTARAVAFDIKFELPSIKAVVESGIKNNDTSDCMFLTLLLMFMMASGFGKEE